MAVVADPVVTPPRPDQTVAKKILRVIGKAPVHLFLLFVAVLWLVPTIGLAVTSLMSAQDYSQFGWWNVISHPHNANLGELLEPLQQHQASRRRSRTTDRDHDRRDGAAPS